MKVILLNQNPAVSRLVRLSIEKIGYKLEEYSNIAQLDEGDPADVFICDHELVDDSVDYTPFGKHIIFLVPRNFAKKLGKHTLEKPFLPTDFMDFVERVATSGDDETGLEQPSSDDFSETSTDSQDFSSGLDDVDLDTFDDFDDLADDGGLDVKSELSRLDDIDESTEDIATSSDEPADISNEPSEPEPSADESSSESRDELQELDTENLDDILGQLDFEDDEPASDENAQAAQIAEVDESSDEGLDTTLADAFVDGGEDDLIEDKIPAELANSDAEGQDDLIEESIPENLADEKKEQLAQLSSMVDEIDDMDTQDPSDESGNEVEASDDDGLDMTDFKDLVGVSDEPEPEVADESMDEVAGLEEITEDIAPADEIANVDEVVVDEIKADEIPTSSELSQEERIARLKEEMAKAEKKTAAVMGETLSDEDIEISEEVEASDDDNLDMTDFKELVGVSDEPETDEIATDESSDEISGLEEIAEISEDIAPADDEITADEIAEVADESMGESTDETSDDDSLDMTDFKELVGVSDEPETDEIATDESSDEISGLEEIAEISEDIAPADDEITADEIAEVADEITPSDESALESSGDDEFGSIDESDLAAALGLDTADIPKSSTASSPKQENSSVDIEQAKSQISSQITETIGATLASSPALKEAIKGMKIKINISFEE